MSAVDTPRAFDIAAEAIGRRSRSGASVHVTTGLYPRAVAANDAARCVECDVAARIWLGDEPLCDRCFNRRAAERTGIPHLPDPPTPEEITGPDGRRHRISYRLILGPAGIEARAEEGDDSGDGYRIELLADHDADPRLLSWALRRRIRAEIAAPCLEPSEYGVTQWEVRDRQVRGRLCEDQDEEESWLDVPRVVVDGRPLSWDEFGRLLQPFVGWEIHITLGEERWHE